MKNLDLLTTAKQEIGTERIFSLRYFSRLLNTNNATPSRIQTAETYATPKFVSGGKKRTKSNNGRKEKKLIS